METLSSTEPHYIRCVKPNSLNRPQKFETQSILHQLRCGVSIKLPWIAHLLPSFWSFLDFMYTISNWSPLSYLLFGLYVKFLSHFFSYPIFWLWMFHNCTCLSFYWIQIMLLFHINLVIYFNVHDCLMLHVFLLYKRFFFYVKQGDLSQLH